MQLEVRCDADASFAVDEGVSVALSLGSVLTSGGGKAVHKKKRNAFELTSSISARLDALFI